MVAQAVSDLFQQEFPGASLYPELREQDFPIAATGSLASVVVEFPGGWNSSPALALLTVSDPDSGRTCTKRITVLLRRRTTAVLADRALRPGEIIQPTDIRIDSAIVPLSSNVCCDVADAVGKRVKRAVSRGGVVMAGHIEEPPAILRGEDAYLYLDTSRLAVRCRVTAMSDGWIGDQIIVKSLATGKKLSATVAETEASHNKLVVLPRQGGREQ
jgi:flagella basal body P-ring formation protein FlgA